MKLWHLNITRLSNTQWVCKIELHIFLCIFHTMYNYGLRYVYFVNSIPCIWGVDRGGFRGMHNPPVRLIIFIVEPVVTYNMYMMIPE